jgi:hypothetical protein
MNQHITKLVRQALKECVSTPVESVIASRIDDHGIVEIPNTFAEKFAELIVKQCAGVAEVSMSISSHPDDRLTVKNSVLKHFRVEE